VGIFLEFFWTLYKRFIVCSIIRCARWTLVGWVGVVCGVGNSFCDVICQLGIPWNVGYPYPVTSVGGWYIGVILVLVQCVSNVCYPKILLMWS